MVLAVCPQRIVAQTNTFPLTGNAGVGTTSPGSRFVVKNTDGVSIGAGSTYSGIGFNRSVDDGASFSSTRNAYQITNHDSYLGFDIWNGSGTSTFTDVLNISSGGKVGIGSATPATTLHVVGDATFSNNIAINGATLKPWQGGKALQGPTGGVFLGKVGDTHTISNAYTTLTGTGWKYITTGTAANLYMYQGDNVFRNAISGSADTNGNLVNHMIITAGGNVGIGTTSPGNMLTVTGSAGITTPDGDATSQKANELLYMGTCEKATFFMSN